MQILRILAIVIIAVGWLAPWQSEISRGILASAAGENIVMAQDNSASSGAPDDKQIETKELSEEEMAKELEEIEAAAGMENAESIKEFKPSRPLPADLPIELPSDI